MAVPRNPVIKAPFIIAKNNSEIYVLGKSRCGCEIKTVLMLKTESLDVVQNRTV